MTDGDAKRTLAKAQTAETKLGPTLLPHCSHFLLPSPTLTCTHFFPIPSHPPQPHTCH